MVSSNNEDIVSQRAWNTRLLLFLFVILIIINNMKLIIDTTHKNKIYIAVKRKQNFLAKKTIKSELGQSEKLLPSISELLKNNKIHLSDIREILVNNQGGSFTSLRIGVTIANALAFALKIPVKSLNNANDSDKISDFNVISPKYSKEPNITMPKKVVD